MGCGQHNYRRANRMDFDPQAEASERAGDRRVSAEQGGDVMRILEGTRRNRFVRALEQRAATDFAEVEPVAKRLVHDVRKNGDRALRRYATRWDGLGKNEPLRVPEQELQKAWQQTSPDLQNAIRQAAANIRRYCGWQRPQEWQHEIQPGVCVGQLVRP
ncbi:MAG: histidinol dehydrogenase, partial [Candidatus Sulfotelmatobacter sp.]